MVMVALAAAAVAAVAVAVGRGRGGGWSQSRWRLYRTGDVDLWMSSCTFPLQLHSTPRGSDAREDSKTKERERAFTLGASKPF